MKRPARKQILAALSQVIDPELGGNLVDLGMVRELKIGPAGEVSFLLALTVKGCPLRFQLQQQAEQAVMAVPGVSCVEVHLGSMSEDERRKVWQGRSTGAPEASSCVPGSKSWNGGAGPEIGSPSEWFNRIGHVVAVISGKGGVGKSSVTALLAAALQRSGRPAGILDADLTGPSIPRLFGVKGPVAATPFGMNPVETRTGIKVISTNLMLPDENMALAWRGPVMSGAIRQFWKDVVWGALDVLLIDLPPGTSDATLTVLQSLPLSGVVLVTTPQSLAAMVVRKTVDMSNILHASILGVVENMAYFPCPETGVRHEIFGPSHAEEVARAANAPLLGRLPIDPELARLGDAGKIEDYVHPAAAELAEAFLAVQPARPEPAPAD